MKLKAFNYSLQLSIEKITTLTGVLGLGATAYLIYRKLVSTPSSFRQIRSLQQQEQQKSFTQIFQQVIQSIQQIYYKNNKQLTNQVIKQIIKNQNKLAQTEFKQIILKKRLQRRKVMKEKVQYIKIIKDVQIAVDQLMDKNLNIILANFRIDKTDWLDSVDSWVNEAEENLQQWENLLEQLDRRRLDSLRNPINKPLSYSKLQQIIKFKIHSLEHINQSQLDFQNSVLSTQQQQQSYLNVKYELINTYINDLVFKKFNTEQEDINYSQTQLNNSDKDKFVNIDEEFRELIRLQIFGEDTENNDQQQIAHEDDNLNNLNDDDDDQAQYY